MLMRRGRVLLRFGVSAMLVMMQGLPMMMGGLFVMRRRLMMMFAGRMFLFWP